MSPSSSMALRRILSDSSVAALAKLLTISGLAFSADSPIFPSASTAAFRTLADSSFKTAIRIGTADSILCLQN